MGRLAETLRSFVLGPFSSGDPALARLFGGTPPAAGISVTEYTALNFSAVWQAVTIIAGGIASLPLILYKRRQGGGRDRFPEHPLYKLLHDEPNPESSAMVFRETLLAHCLTWGNGYAEIESDQAGRPIALWPITPDRVEPYREASGRLLYRVHREAETGYDVLTPAEMFHVPGLGFDGVCGYSVIRKARESVSLGLAAERYGARFFGSGAMFSVALEHPARLSAEAQKRLKDNWTEQHGGVDRSHGVAVLEEGMKVSKLSIPPEDAQFLESRKFQVVEIARWFNLSPRKLRDVEKANAYASVEQDAIDHVTDTLRPWMVRFEQECNRKLIRPLERRIQYVEHLADGLLRGVTLDRYQAHAVARQWGWASADDVRAIENQNPLPNGQGQVYLAPMNMVPADKLQELTDAEIEAKTKPAAAPAPAKAEPEPEPARALPPTNGNGGPPDPAQRARVIAAQRAVFIEGVGRMVRREGTNIRRALKKGPASFRAWLPEFYRTHAEVFAAALLPAMQAHLSQVQSDQDPAAAARALATTYCTESAAVLTRLLDTLADSAALAEHVDHLVSRWEIERPAELADHIMQEELTHAIQ